MYLELENYFDVKVNGRNSTMFIPRFLEMFFGDRFHQTEITSFTNTYNKLIGKTSSKEKGEVSKVRDFKFEPTNVRETFKSLTTETYPMGSEEEVVKYLTPDLTKDEFGNYYKIIGKSDTCFTCHLDTASRTKDNVSIIEYKKDEQDFIMTDGTSILGADDKSRCCYINVYDC
jgi:hypothetical protein